ncbi:hypothetical protein AMS59_13740 [Lysinibacillus sp. FJAT-14745]|uniref:DUF6414 family protein n=1 Tax=Lysinibacillus sp. FJAT-14745 TaxID=1704289 RepID=UPI0006AB92EA|nr:DUF6414 family protein [Lysinibacillus sp. FJAT-14745]KOP78155.1 hypothetical protein AMS59_13740 [Lysinibacillus sp. FJAT-14745]
MKKIIYFDEGSATDILLMEHGGQITEINEQTGSVSLKGNAEGSVDVGAGTGFLTIVKAAFSTKVSTSVSHEKDSLATKTVTNTILTDFLTLKGKLLDEKKVVELKGYKVYALKDSFAYLKMYAPYMKILKEDSGAIEGIQDFNLQNVDEILSAAKGYYELLAFKGEDKAILRFNINVFKNAYMLTDLPKMNLMYIAVEVGDCTENELLIQNELSGSNSTAPQETIDIDRLMDVQGANIPNNNRIKLYDVILGGVGNNEI